MPKIDRTDYYDALASGVAPKEVRVIGTSTTTGWRTGSRATDLVVLQAGKPVLDRDFNLLQGSLDERWTGVLAHQTPSGWLRASRRIAPALDLVVDRAPAGLVDDSGRGVVSGGLLRNGIALRRLDALVAGTPIVVEYTGTRTPGWNIVPLDPPSIYDGTPKTVKRTDFVFLEVWRALVAPGGRATAFVVVLDVKAITDGDLIDVGGQKLVARSPGPPAAPGEFAVGATPEATTINIEMAATDPAWPGSRLVTTRANGAEADFFAPPGAAGNALSVAVTTAQPGALKVSGGTFSGGYDQPARPSQTTVYRHGNVLSPARVALSDEILDAESNQETCLRVQTQYRLRATGVDEAVSFRDHPDGFSSPSSGGPQPAVFAQGGRNQPVWVGNLIDKRSYPFVPADGRSSWLDSSAARYGDQDDGLWVAGDGTAQAAMDLGSVDGFVLALPVCLVFRRNDCSTTGAVAVGFDPRNNANGAPTSDHKGYTTAAGLVVPAGRSDRPDGSFSDLVRAHDLLDLRRHAAPAGNDFTADLAHQSQRLLRGELRTWAGDAAGRAGALTGEVGTSHLLAEEFGRTASSGGAPPSSGDTGIGRCARNLDHVARTFSGRSTVERVCYALWPGDRPTATAQGGPAKPGREDPAVYVVKREKGGKPLAVDSWTEGDVLHVDLDQMDCSQLGSEFDGRGGDGTSAPAARVLFPDLAPPGTVITDVVFGEHDDGLSAADAPREVEVRWVRGLGTRHVEVCLLRNDRSADGGLGGATSYRFVGRDDGGLPGSPRRIFLELEVSYPPGGGLAATPTGEAQPDPVVYDGKTAGLGPVVEADATQRPADFEFLARARVIAPAREARVEYVANVTPTHKAGAGKPGVPVDESVVSRNRYDLVLPRRVFGGVGLVTVTDAVSGKVLPVDEVATPFGSSERVVRLQTPFPSPGSRLCNVTYFPQDPLPNYGAAGYQVAVFYPAAAPQTAGVRDGASALPPAVRLEVMAEASSWVLQAGAGSPESDRLSPRGDLVPLRDGRLLGDVTRDDALSAGASVSVSGLQVPSGALRLPALVPVPCGAVLLLGGTDPSALPRRDAEGRAYYPAASQDGEAVRALAAELSGPARHRVAVPLLCRALEDVYTTSGGLLLRRSEVVLVVLSRYGALDASGSVEVGPFGVPEQSSAALYRVEGSWMAWTGEREVLP